MEKRVAVITGGSSGIGYCTARALSAKDCTVYEISRRESSVQGVVHMSADVTDENAVKAVIEEIVKREGRIDILINNAGFGISGAVEFTELADAKRLFDVNFFGTVNTSKAVIHHMREAGAGRIINISSVAAPAPIPFQTYYSASKAAISSYSQALGNEIKPFGISVCAILPGDIKTGFTDARKKNPAGDDIYGGRISRSVSSMEHDEQNGMSPEKAGEYIAKIALRKRVKPLYAIGFAYKAAAVLATILPSRLRSLLIGFIYAR